MRNHIDKFKDFLLNENINMSPIFVCHLREILSGDGVVEIVE